MKGRILSGLLAVVIVLASAGVANATTVKPANPCSWGVTNYPVTIPQTFGTLFSGICAQFTLSITNNDTTGSYYVSLFADNGVAIPINGNGSVYFSGAAGETKTWNLTGFPSSNMTIKAVTAGNTPPISTHWNASTT